LRCGAPGEVREPVVGLDAVEVAHVQGGAVLGEGGKHEAVDAEVLALAVDGGGDEGVAVGVGPALEYSALRSHTAEVADLVARDAGGRSPTLAHADSFMGGWMVSPTWPVPGRRQSPRPRLAMS